MYESTGLYGKSKVYKNINLKTGEEAKSYSFDDLVFAEGSVIFKNKLYVLTYKEKKVFEFDFENLEVSHVYDYGREGWGLTTNGEYLIANKDGKWKEYDNYKVEQGGTGLSVFGIKDGKLYYSDNKSIKYN